MKKFDDIIYLHGYQGENSVKFDILKDHFDDQYEVIKPKQVLKPFENFDNLENFFKDHKYSFIIGSSLGGFYTLLLSLKYKNPCLLINPSYRPGTGQLKEKLPEEYIKQFEILRNKIKEYVEKNESGFNFLNFFISKDDNVIDHTDVTNDFKMASKNFRFFENKGHGFAYLNENLEDIKNIIEKYEHSGYEGMNPHY